MDAATEFFERCVEQPHWAQQTGAFGVAGLATLITSYYLPAPMVGAGGAISAVALAALRIPHGKDARESDPLVVASVGVLAASSLICLIELGKALSGKISWSLPDLISRAAGPALGLGLGLHVLYTGYSIHSAPEVEMGAWSSLCKNSARFVIPASFSMLLTYLNVSPALMLPTLPLITYGACYLKERSDDPPEEALEYVKMGAVIASLSLCPLTIVSRIKMTQLWGWHDLGGITALALTTMACAIESCRNK